MKLKDAKDRYWELSKQASANTRTLALAGIAVVWIFRESGSPGTLPHNLEAPLFWFIVTLSLDYLQYYLGTAIWLWYYRWKERQPKKDEQVSSVSASDGDAAGEAHSEWWPNIQWFLFFTKGVVLGYGYSLLATVITSRIFAM